MKHWLAKIGNGRTSVALLFILLVATGLRLWHIDFGLPNVYQPDEDAVVMPAMSILKTGDFHPTRMEYGTTWIYLLTGVYAVVFSLSSRDGFIGTVEELVIFERGTYPAIFPHPEYVLAGRVTSALFGTFIVLIVFMLGRRLAGERLGLMAALFAAFVPDLAIRSHFATTDTPLTFMTTLSLYLLLRVYDEWYESNGWTHAGAGFICGLAASTKYNGVLLLIPLAILLLLKSRSLDDLFRMRSLAGFLGMAVGFLAGTPYALLDIPDFLSWFGYSLRLYNRPGVEIVQPAWQWHLSKIGFGRNAAIFWLGVAGFMLSWRFWGKRSWMLNGFAIVFVIAMVSQTNRQARMWLPLAPLFAIWGALTVDWFAEKLGKWAPESFYQKLIWLPAILVTVTLAFYSIRQVYNFGQKDVRTVTQEWIVVHVPAGSRIAFDYFAPNLDVTNWQTERFIRHVEHDVAWYTDQGFQYLLFSQFMYELVGLSAEEAHSYQNLVEQLCPEQSFKGTFLSNAAIEMRLYKIPPCS